jgi:hypothetical protein
MGVEAMASKSDDVTDDKLAPTDEPDDVWSAPESGQPPGGRDAEPDMEFDGSSEWPSTSRQEPKDEL